MRDRKHTVEHTASVIVTNAEDELVTLIDYQEDGARALQSCTGLDGDRAGRGPATLIHPDQFGLGVSGAGEGA